MSSVEVQSQPVKAGEPELAGLLADWSNTFGLRLRARLRLLMAETKLAVTTFALVIFMVVLAAGSVIMAWGLILLAMVQALSLAGLTLLLALVVTALLHLVFAWLLWRLANHMSRHMEFRATRGLMKS